MNCSGILLPFHSLCLFPTPTPILKTAAWEASVPSHVLAGEACPLCPTQEMTNPCTHHTVRGPRWGFLHSLCLELEATGKEHGM